MSCLQRKQSNWHCGKLHIFAIKISGEEHLWDFVVIVTANHQLIWWWKLVWPGHWQWSSAELWQWSPEQIFKSLHLSILLACLGHSHLQHNLQMVIITNYHQWIPYYPKPESPFSPSPPPPLNQQEFTPSPKCPPNTQWGGLSPTPRANRVPSSQIITTSPLPPLVPTWLKERAPCRETRRPPPGDSPWQERTIFVGARKQLVVELDDNDNDKSLRQPCFKRGKLSLQQLNNKRLTRVDKDTINCPEKAMKISHFNHIMIELCYFSLDKWEIKIHLLWGKCFNIPHWPRSHSTNGR